MVPSGMDIKSEYIGNFNFPGCYQKHCAVSSEPHCISPAAFDDVWDNDGHDYYSGGVQSETFVSDSYQHHHHVPSSSHRHRFQSHDSLVRDEQGRSSCYYTDAASNSSPPFYEHTDNRQQRAFDQEQCSSAPSCTWRWEGAANQAYCGQGSCRLQLFFVFIYWSILLSQDGCSKQLGRSVVRVADSVWGNQQQILSLRLDFLNETACSINLCSCFETC